MVMISMPRPIKIVAFIFFVFFSLVHSDENQWSTNGPTGGSVVTIAINPQNNQIIYAGTIEDGTYKTTDGGENWIQIGPDILYPNIRVVKIHPFGPDTIYAATNWGLYKSTSAGIEWILLYPTQNPLNQFRAFIINPIYPNIIFVGGPTTSLQKSTDSGESWYEPNLPSPIGVDGFAIDNQNPDIMYLVSGSVSLGKGILKSTDMGENWFSIQGNIDSAGFGMDVAIDPVYTDILYFAIFDFFNESQSCLWKTTDGGVNWVPININNLMELHCIWDVEVCPYDHNIVFISTRQDGVFRSTDGGISWERKNDGLRVLEPATLEFDTTNGTIYLGTHFDGIYKSTDEGENWENISNNIFLSNVTDLTVNTFDPNYIYVATCNGLYKSYDGSVSWEFVDVGIPYIRPATVEFDKYIPQNIYMSNIFYPWANPAGFFRSTNSGSSWDFFGEDLLGNNHYHYMEISYFNIEDMRIFLASDNGVFISDDLGETWRLCQNGLPSDWYTTISVSPSDPYIVAVGCRFSTMFFLSTDGGNCWSNTNPLPIGTYIGDIEFDPEESDIIYVGVYNGGLYKTIDGGISWIDITNNLPWSEPMYVSGITVNPINTNNIFVNVNYQGVFQSHDGGQSWESFNHDLDINYGTGCLSFASDDTCKMYLGTTMRSVWSITRTTTGITGNDVRIPASVELTNYPNPFNSSTNISFSLPKASEIDIDIYDLLGRKITTLLDSYEPEGNHTVLWQAENISSGIYFYKITAGDFSISKKMILLK